MRITFTENPINERNEELGNIVLLISILNLLIYVVLLYFTSYGISRNELYYLACANRPAVGYVDQPPLSIWILAVWKFFLGDSLFVIRLLPAFISSATIFILGLFTIRLGGGKGGIIIATVTFMITPLFLGMTSTYSMNVFDFFFWILAAYIFLQICESTKSNMWYVLGIIIGLGLLNNTTMLWLGAGVLIGTLFTPLREELKTKQPYIAAGIALLIFSPYIIWNLVHDWAHIEFMKNAALKNYGGLTSMSFIFHLILSLNPLSLLIWAPGIIYYFFKRNSGIFRPLGYIWLVSLTMLFISWYSKTESIVPAFQILFAGGAVMIVQWDDRIKRLKYALVIPVIVLSILLSPFARPVLPVQTFLGYQSAMMLKSPANEEHTSRLPRFYADMFGWKDLAMDVYKVYISLPEEDKKNTVIYCNTYGEAGAIEYFGKRYNLPKVVCPQNNYWYWWPEYSNITTMIFIGGNSGDHIRSFGDKKIAGVHKTEYAIPNENNLPIIIRSGSKRSLQEIKRGNGTFN